MQVIFAVAYLAVGIAQIFAYVEGMHLYFGLGGFLSFIAFLFGYSIPLLGTGFVAVMTYYGARYGWHWEWWQALLLAVPGLIIMIILMAAGGLSSLFERRAY
ncbi:hypothetical protein [Bradyrhizobium paxllaeri]|uniref:hypothetical protein n=1 Tax=Bradyrhizobium paxllaeri TaxID=190148 RepID=UPI000810AE38|nr:hypothetical protein [Bradyrhizobium paxllaeri]